MEKHIKAQLLEENQKVFGLSVLVRIKTDALLADQFRIPSFEEWEKGQAEEQSLCPIEHSMGGLA